MPKKVLFVFAGTGFSAESMHQFIEGEHFKEDIIRVYFNGCQDESIGGNWKVKGYISPDLDVVGGKIRQAFSKVEGATHLSLSSLQRQFGASIIIEPKGERSESEEIDDITLYGYSRGAVSTFSTARALDDLDSPMSILAEDPVPGDTRASSKKEDSLYSKNFDLTDCKNIVRAEVLLGTYSKHNYGWQNKWFRQMAPKFPVTSDSHLYMTSKKSHWEFNNRATTYCSSFFHNRGLTSSRLIWESLNDRLFVIPKVEQQKHHYGIVGRTQYLPSYKSDVLRALKNKYDEASPCPVSGGSKFKSAQALLALHNASMSKEIFDVLAQVVLSDSDKGKALREFIVEFSNIVQYSEENNTPKEVHLRGIATLEQSIYEKIAKFQQLEQSTIRQKEAFAASIQSSIKLAKASLPQKVYNTLNDLTVLLLQENPLMYPQLVQFINDDDETFAVDELAASERALDGAVTNANELALKLFHSSAKERHHVFDKEKSSLPTLIKNVADLSSIAFFLTPSELKETLDLVGNRMSSMSDVLLIMKALPNYEQRKILFHTYKNKLAGMSPNFLEVVHLMEYLSDKKCKELCSLLPIATLPDFDLVHAEGKLPHSKIEVLQAIAPVELMQGSELELAPKSTQHAVFFQAESSLLTSTNQVSLVDEAELEVTSQSPSMNS